LPLERHFRLICHTFRSKKKKNKEKLCNRKWEKKYKINQGKKGNDKNQAAGQNQKEWADKKKEEHFFGEKRALKIKWK